MVNVSGKFALRGFGRKKDQGTGFHFSLHSSLPLISLAYQFAVIVVVAVTMVCLLHCAVQGLGLKRDEGLGFLRVTNLLDLCCCGGGEWRIGRVTDNGEAGGGGRGRWRWGPFSARASTPVICCRASGAISSIPQETDCSQHISNVSNALTLPQRPILCHVTTLGYQTAMDAV